MDFCQVRELLNNSLGKPYYETDKCLLYCGDSRDVLRAVGNTAGVQEKGRSHILTEKWRHEYGADLSQLRPALPDQRFALRQRP